MRKSVLIIEDNPSTAELLRTIVLEINPAARIYTTDVIEKAYYTIMENTIDLFLVDIILDTSAPGDVSGIHFVEKLRTLERYMFTPVIFITSLEDPKLHAYRDLHSFGYLEKPFNIEYAKNIIEKALHFTTRKEECKTIYFRKDGILYAVDIDNIVFVESFNHQLSIHTINDTLIIPYKTCKQLIKEAESEKLLQCSRNSIVNKNYIRNIDIPNRYIELTDSYGKVEIGVTYQKKVMQELNIC